MRFLARHDIVRHEEGPNLVIDMHVSFRRLERNLGRAQKLLDSAIMDDMVPYMPMITGSFVQLTKARSAATAGTGEICAAAPPMGRFLYEGKGMVGEESGSPYAKADERKVLVSKYTGITNAHENLQYTTTFHPDVTAKWFEVAKKAHKREWIKKVNKETKRHA